MEPLTPASSSEPSERRRRVLRWAKPLLFNVWLAAWGTMAILVIPVKANFTPLNKKIMDLDAKYVLRWQPNLRHVEMAFGRGASGVVGHEDVPFHIDTNGEGFRDIDHPLVAPPGTFRVAMFGDSYIFGIGIEQPDTLARRLDQEMNKTDPAKHYDVMSFGLPGLNMEGMGRVTQSMGLKYRPDVATYSFIADDVSRVDIIFVQEELRRLKSTPGVAAQVEAFFFQHFAVQLKEARYEMDYKVLATFPSLYRERIELVLRYYLELAAVDGHDIVMIDYDTQGQVRLAVDAVNRERGSHIEVVDRFPCELNATDHPTPDCNAGLAARIGEVLRRIEARRSASAGRAP